MASTTRKKVSVFRFEREPLSGYADTSTYILPSGVEVLSLQGERCVIPLEQVKWVSFISQFDRAEPGPGGLTFSNRPKTSGLWVRLTFRDGDVMEGVLANDLLHLDQSGFLIVPPAAANTQKVFVPKAALSQMDVLGVVGSSLRRGRKAREVPRERQPGLFDQ